MTKKEEKAYLDGAAEVLRIIEPFSLETIQDVVDDKLGKQWEKYFPVIKEYIHERKQKEHDKGERETEVDNS